MLTRKMKDSGIEWIGEIPEDWDVVQVKHLFEIGRGRVISKEELKFDSQTGYPVYSSQTKNDGVLGFIGTYDFDQPQLTWTTDGANAGTVFLRKGKYNCTNVCGTLKLKSDIQDKISLDYVYHALYVGAPYYKRKDTNGYKIMNNEMAVIKIPLPSFDIQKKISKEIERKIKTINNLIIKTEQSIEELKKYKQSLITEAVTKGLDPNVEMKDSGIEWIGAIPSRWGLNQIKTVAKVMNGKEIETDGGHIPVFGSGGVFKYTNTKLYDKESVLFGRKGTIGKPLIVNQPFWTVDTMFYTHIFENRAFPKWLYYILISLPWDVYSTQTAIPSIVGSEIESIRIPVPSIEEQRQIISYLDEQTSRIDKLINDKTKVIEELEDYKKSLIYEYVTGKKEV